MIVTTSRVAPPELVSAVPLAEAPLKGTSIDGPVELLVRFT